MTTTPSALRAYLRQRGEASLSEMAAHFGADADLIQDLLGYWQKKGRIRTSGADCGKSCARCAEGYRGAVFYQWRDAESIR
jgi:hypothetical protein